MLHRLLHRSHKRGDSSIGGLHALTRAASPVAPAKTPKTPAAHPSGIPAAMPSAKSHKRSDSAVGNSWSVSGANGGGGDSLTPDRVTRHRRLDSHVVNTKRGGATGPTMPAPEEPFVPPTKRSSAMQLRTYVNAHRAHIFIIVLFYLVCFGIFGERFWTFSMQIEHVGVRRIVQWSVPITRGSASVIAFTMGMLLLTMSRNLICYLQTTRMARFIPFQSAMAFHILVAYTCLASMFCHVVGHFFNVSTQQMRSRLITGK